MRGVVWRETVGKGRIGKEVAEKTRRQGKQGRREKL